MLCSHYSPFCQTCLLYQLFLKFKKNKDISEDILVILSSVWKCVNNIALKFSLLHPSLIVIFPVRNMLYLINPCKQYYIIFLIVQFIDLLHITSPVFLAVDAVLTE